MKKLLAALGLTAAVALTSACGSTTHHHHTVYVQPTPTVTHVHVWVMPTVKPTRSSSIGLVKVPSTKPTPKPSCSKRFSLKKLTGKCQ